MWSTDVVDHIVIFEQFLMMMRSFLLLLIIFHSANDFYFWIILFPINEIYPWKVIPYHVGHIVHDEVGGMPQ